MNFTPDKTPTPPQDQVERFTTYISMVSWRFARTMPKYPHFYTNRFDRPDLDDVFTDFARFIRQYGYKQNFFKKTMVYFNIGEFKYWTMGSKIMPPDHNKNDNTYILNRARVENVYG